MAAGLHHLALGARDVANLAAFYRDQLGLVEVGRFDEPDGGGLRSVWLALGGGAVLMIEKTEQAARPEVDGREAGLFLLAVACDAGRLESLASALRELGVEQVAESQFSRYFRDPEGNRFALSCYPLPG